MKKRLLIFSFLAVILLFTGIAAAENDTSKMFLEKNEISSNCSISETNLVNSQKSEINLTVQEDMSSLDKNINVYSYESLKIENKQEINEINTKNVELYYNNGTKFTASLNDNISNQQVTFQINGVDYNKITNYQGIVNLNLNLNPGIYNITTIYNNITVNNTIKVISTIDAPDLIKYYKNSTQFSGKFVDNHGNPLKNTKVSFYLNGVFYNRFTDNNGIAVLNINLNPGNYVMASTNPLNNEMKVSKITVLSTIIGNDVVKYYRNDTNYNIKIKDLSGNPLANANVSFYINGIFYSKKTDANGEAYLNINLDPGKYIVITVNSLNNECCYNVIQVLKAKTFIIGFNVQSFGNNANFTVNLVYENNAPIKNQKVNFKIQNKTFYSVTDNNGTATVYLENLQLGKNVIEYEFIGNKGFDSSKDRKIISATNSTFNFKSNDIIMEYGDKNSFNVTVKDSNNIPVKNKNITFSINGRNYVRSTDENGTARININLNPGKYDLDYFSYNGSEMDIQGFNEIFVNKKTVVLYANDLVMNYNDSSKFKVLAVSNNGTPIDNLAIKFNISGIEYIRLTDSNGFAELNINLLVGYYNISYSLENILFFSDFHGSSNILVNGSKIYSNEVYGLTNSPISFSVKLVDAFEKPISNATIRFYTSTKKAFTQITDSNGIATISLNNLDVETYQVSYYYFSSKGNVSGMNYIYVKQAITISSLISASINLRNYIESNYKLPEAVTIDNKDYSIPQFLYLVSLAISNIKNNNFSQISAIDLKSPSNPIKSLNLGNLYDYISLSKSAASYMLNNKIAPNSIHSDVGDVGYDSLVYAFARVLAYYGEHGSLPSYVAIKSIEAPRNIGPLDSLNTIKDLTSYLKASKNCQIDNAAIKSLASSLTSKLSNDYDKANAIFNYVKSHVSYSFYYNTKYGATGTLNYKVGNCCDQAHLVVALCRASGIPARYVHGTCKYSSGNFYGHVWTQILINNVWVVADTTSSKNSLGIINNWDSNTYILNGYYSSLNF